MINSAKAPPSWQRAAPSLRAQQLRVQPRLAGGWMLWSAGGCRGSSARDLGSLPEMQRVGDLCAAVVSPLQEGQDGEKLIPAPAPRHDPPACPDSIRYPLLASCTFILNPPCENNLGLGLFFKASPPTAKDVRPI